MPTNYGTYECVEEYLDLCAKIGALFNESEAVYMLVLGDFNCEFNVSCLYYDILMQFFCLIILWYVLICHV